MISSNTIWFFRQNVVHLIEIKISRFICFNKKWPIFRHIFENEYFLCFQPPCERKPKLMFSEPSLYSAATCFIECALLLPIVSACQCIPYMRSERYHTCEIEEIYACSIMGEMYVEIQYVIELSRPSSNRANSVERGCTWKGLYSVIDGTLPVP